MLPPRTQRERHFLETHAVPATVIQILPGETRNDWDRARILLDWMREHPEEHVALLCNRFGSRRLRIILDRVLGSDARRVHLVALADRRYDETNWWRSKDGVVAFWDGFSHLGYVSLAGEGDGPGPSWDADAWERSLP